MKHWYYEKDGTRAGPVSEDVLRTLVSEGTLRRENLVWTSEYGTDWKALGETELSSLVVMDENSPPPLPASSINNTYVWIMAFVPLIGFVIERIAASMVPAETWNNSFKFVLFAYIGTYIGLAKADELALQKTGRDTSKFAGMLWFVPVYLFKRATYTTTSRATFWTWVGTFVGALFISGNIADMMSGTYYWGAGTPACDSRPVLNLAKNLYDTKLPIARLTGTTALEFTQIKQTAYDSKLKQRTCTAMLRTSAGGALSVIYTVKLQGDQYLVEIRPQL